MTVRFLPVKAADRQEWVPQVPAGVENRAQDWVSYKAVGDTVIDHASTNCYSRLGRNYQEYEIHCRPTSKTQITLEDTFSFFNTMTEHLIIPEKVSLWEEENGIHCRIPKGAGTNPLLYAALTCYRWLDSNPPLVWQFVRIMERPEKRHPLQILPFLISTHVSNCNHSFISTGGWKVVAPGAESANNPLLGLAAKIFFDPQDPRGDHRLPIVNSTIGLIASQLTRTTRTKLKNPGPWGPRNLAVPVYQLREPGDGLHPALYELYTIPNITKEQIEEILSRLFTEEEEQCSEEST